NPERQQRNHGTAGSCVIRRFWTGDASNVPFPERFRLFAEFLLRHIREKRSKCCTCARKNADEKSEQGAADDRDGAVLHILLRREDAVDFRNRATFFVPF